MAAIPRHRWRMSFSGLGLSPQLIAATRAKGFTVATPVQAAAIPPIIRGDDVQASAQTGSGKTAAFALPILQRLQETPLARPRTLHALILAPTRELAAQIGTEIDGYAQALPQSVKTVAVFGGVSINTQMLELRGGAEIVVATPGRLLDLVTQNALWLGSAGTLVLDEADRLFALGFADELARVIALLPKRRQNLLFSATFPAEVQSLADSLLHHPQRIAVESAPEGKPDIEQRAIETDEASRTQLLRHLLKTNPWRSVLVFLATKYATEHVADKLQKAGIAAAAFHGELSQGRRTLALEDFKAGKLRVLLVTDLASRGLDIAQLAAVVNYDLPRSATDYTHRIGRTGRAGESGVAISFVTAATHAHFRLIEKRNHLDIPREQVAGFEPSVLAAPEAAAPTATSASTHGGGVKGKRKSKKDRLREAKAVAEWEQANAARGKSTSASAPESGRKTPNAER